MTTEVDTSQNQQVSELEGLLQLAEQSSTKIDQLNTAIARIRQRIIIATMVAYLAFSGLALGAPYLEEVSKSISSTSYAKALLVILAITCTIFAVVLLFINFSQLRVLKRVFRVEKDIHDRLILMVDEQLRRLNSNTLTAVARATIEIRVRRLDRSDIRPDKKFI